LWYSLVDDAAATLRSSELSAAMDVASLLLAIFEGVQGGIVGGGGCRGSFGVVERFFGGGRFRVAATSFPFSFFLDMIIGRRVTVGVVECQGPQTQ
jgi:hypothetical protein